GSESLVGVEYEHPLAARVTKRLVAGGGEVVVPREIEHARAGLAPEVPGRVGASGVHDHHLVHGAANRGQAPGQKRRLVADDHAERDSGHDLLLPTAIGRPAVSPNVSGLPGERRQLDDVRADTELTRPFRTQAPPGRLGTRRRREPWWERVLLPGLRCPPSASA